MVLIDHRPYRFGGQPSVRVVIDHEARRKPACPDACDSLKREFKVGGSYLAVIKAELFPDRIEDCLCSSDVACRSLTGPDYVLSSGLQVELGVECHYAKYLADGNVDLVADLDQESHYQIDRDGEIHFCLALWNDDLF